MKTIKKHVLFTYLRPFLWSIIAFLIIMIVVHFFDFMHTFLRHRPTLYLLLRYFSNRIPEWLVLITPVGTLVATLFALGTLKKNNELVAIQSSGIRLLYVLKPIVIFSLFVSITSGIIAEGIVPESTSRADKLFSVIKDEQPEEISKSRENFTYLSENSNLFFIKEFDGKNSITGLNITTFYQDTTIEKERYTAEKAIYKNGTWKLINWTQRIFDKKNSEVQLFEKNREKHINLEISPDILSTPRREPEDMGLVNLYNYIQRFQAGGHSTTGELVLLHHKIAFPFANTIILILGIPLALVGETHSRTSGFFISLIISFIYWGSISVGRSLGTGGVLPPAIAAWSAHLLFFTISLILMRKVKLF